VSVSVPIGVLGMVALHGQYFAAPRPARLKYVLSGASGHPRAKTMYPSAMSAFGLICSFRHDTILYTSFVMFNGQEIIPVVSMIGKKRVGLNFESSFDEAGFYLSLKNPQKLGYSFF
jgi:hypothetical protein